LFSCFSTGFLAWLKPLVRAFLTIPKLSQNLILDCASILIFAAASIGHVQEHGLLPQRLRLLQI
jgi:hypothetical protein